MSTRRHPIDVGSETLGYVVAELAEHAAAAWAVGEVERAERWARGAWQLAAGLDVVDNDAPLEEDGR